MLAQGRRHAAQARLGLSELRSGLRELKCAVLGRLHLLYDLVVDDLRVCHHLRAPEDLTAGDAFGIAAPLHRLPIEASEDTCTVPP